MQRRDLNANDAPPPVAAYTQAIEVTGATRTLYISGQVGQRMDGSIPDDIVERPATPFVKDFFRYIDRPGGVRL